MITKLSLLNFKCFDKIEIPLNNLTLLAGTNGSGKSTIIQALLLIKQSYKRYNNLTKIVLSDDYIKMGKSNDILYENNDEDTSNIRIQLNYDNTQMIDINLEYETDKSVLNNCIQCNSLDEDHNCLLSNRFEYVAADRISPESVYPAMIDTFNLGIHGEYTMFYLSNYGTNAVEKNLCLESYPNDLLSQVDAWLQKMFNGFCIRIEDVVKADAVSLRFQEVSRDDKSNEHRPINVGYGITYILPVIVALLKAKEGDLVVIENPECHLHPKAQRIIGELISRAANIGAQVMIETHSDHVLNGIRLSVKNNIVNKEKVQILFVSREDVGRFYHTNVYSPLIQENGDLDVWPEGFFDEWDNALIDLLR